jgi:hypothetical protein
VNVALIPCCLSYSKLLIRERARFGIDGGQEFTAQSIEGTMKLLVSKLRYCLTDASRDNQRFFGEWPCE